MYWCPHIPLWYEKCIMMWISNFCQNKFFLCYSDNLNRVVDTVLNITIPWGKTNSQKVLLHIIRHNFFPLTNHFEPCGWFYRFLLSHLFHTPKYTDLTYMWVQFKWKHLVFNRNKNVWGGGGRIRFFTFCDLNKTFFLCPNFTWKLAHKWSMN